MNTEEIIAFSQQTRFEVITRLKDEVLTKNNPKAQRILLDYLAGLSDTAIQQDRLQLEAKAGKVNEETQAMIATLLRRINPNDLAIPLNDKLTTSPPSLPDELYQQGFIEGELSTSSRPTDQAESVGFESTDKS